MDYDHTVGLEDIPRTLDGIRALTVAQMHHILLKLGVISNPSTNIAFRAGTPAEKAQLVLEALTQHDKDSPKEKKKNMQQNVPYPTQPIAAPTQGQPQAGFGAPVTPGFPAMPGAPVFQAPAAAPPGAMPSMPGGMGMPSMPGMPTCPPTTAPGTGIPAGGAVPAAYMGGTPPVPPAAGIPSATGQAPVRQVATHPVGGMPPYQAAPQQPPAVTQSAGSDAAPAIASLGKAVLELIGTLQAQAKQQEERHEQLLQAIAASGGTGDPLAKATFLTLLWLASNTAKQEPMNLAAYVASLLEPSVANSFLSAAGLGNGQGK